MKITAAVAREHDRPLSLETLTLSSPADDEVVVEVLATGICHTDLVVKSGLLPTPLPVVLGHEGAGIVKEVGANVDKVVVGDHVVMTFDHCDACPSCHDNMPSYCHEFFPKNFFAQRSDGTTALSDDNGPVHSHFFGQSSFASFAICRQTNVIKVSKSADLKKLGPLACGIQTGAGAVMNALKVAKDKSFVVFGAGSVGLSSVMAAKINGAHPIIAVDKNPARLETAKSLGATHTIVATDDTLETLMSITQYGVNYALDTTGIPAVIRIAVESLAPRGTCGILGASGPDAEICLNETHFMSGGRHLIGIVEGESQPDTFIPYLIELNEKGEFPFEQLISYYDYKDINQAINDIETGKAIKPILLWQQR